MYIVPKEVVEALVKLGYEKEDIENVENIDLGFYSPAENIGQDIVVYALYRDDDENSDDVIEFTVDTNDFWIEQNGEPLTRGECYYDIDQANDKPIGELIVVD